MTKIVNLQYNDELQNIVVEKFMISTNQYQIFGGTKYLSLNDNKLTSTNDMSDVTSYWYVLQSSTSNKIGLCNAYSKSLLTYSNGKFVISETKLNENEPNNVTLFDLWIPMSELKTQISFKNVGNNEKYLWVQVENNNSFYFILDHGFVDFPGNCNINGIELKNVNCKYFLIETTSETTSKYCFRRSTNYVYLNTSDFNYYFELNGTSIKSNTKNNIDTQKWYIWKDNFNRLLLQPFSIESFVDVSDGINITKINVSITENNIFNLILDGSKYYLSPINNGNLYLQALTNENNSDVLLYGNKTNISFNTNSIRFCSINELNYQSVLYKQIELSKEKAKIISPTLKINLSTLRTITAKTELIDNNLYNPTEINSTNYKTELTKKYFEYYSESNFKFSGCEFKYTVQSVIDFINLILPNIKTHLNTDKSIVDFSILKLIFDLYTTFNQTSSNITFNDVSEFMMKTDEQTPVDDFTKAIGWNKYFSTANSNILNSASINSINHILTKLNIFMLHTLDNIFYNSGHDLSNDFTSIFTYDNKLISFAVVTNLIQSLVHLTNNKSLTISNLMPTYSSNDRNGIAYWTNPNGYWNDNKSEITYSIIETTDNINSEWNSTNNSSTINSSIINTDDFNNVFRIYSNVENDEPISTKDANQIYNENDTLTMINNTIEHVYRDIRFGNVTKYLETCPTFSDSLMFNTSNFPLIGTRPEGSTSSVEYTLKESGYSAVIMITEKKRISHTNTGTYRGRNDLCNSGPASHNHDETQTRAIYSKYDWPSKIEMWLYNEKLNVSYGPVVFNDYNIEIDTKFVGYDQDYKDCDETKDTAASQMNIGGTGGIETISLKIKTPTEFMTQNSTITLTNSNGTTSKFIVKQNMEFAIKIGIQSITNNLITTDQREVEDGVYYSDKNWIRDKDEVGFLSHLHTTNLEEHSWNGVKYYGNIMTVDNAFDREVNETKVFYAGNVYSENPSECSSQSGCNDILNRITTIEPSHNYSDEFIKNNQDELKKLRCFVVPNKDLTISVLDDRFDYLLLYWLYKNKTGLSKKLADEIYNLFYNNPELLLPYRIYKNYIGCKFKQYFNIENFLGPPMLYVNPGLKITEYSNYFASDFNDQDGYKQITLTTTSNDIKRKFVANLMNKTAILDKMFYNFINTTSYVTQPGNILSDSKFYVCFNIYMNYSDLMMYTEVEPSINFNYNLKPYILYSLTDHVFDTDFAFIYTNDSSINQQAQLYLKCGEYKTPYVFNTTNKFEYNTKDIYLYFYHKDSYEDENHNTQKANIYMGSNINNETPYVFINANPNISNSYNQGYLKINDHISYTADKINTNIGYETDKLN